MFAILHTHLFICVVVVHEMAKRLQVEVVLDILGVHMQANGIWLELWCVHFLALAVKA